MKKRKQIKLHLIRYYWDRKIIFKLKKKTASTNQLNAPHLFAIDRQIHLLESTKFKTLETLKLNITQRQAY